jgi:hypothetical protein
VGSAFTAGSTSAMRLVEASTRSSGETSRFFEKGDRFDRGQLPQIVVHGILMS